MLSKVLKKFGCTDKFVSLTKSLHDDIHAGINFNGTISEPFPVEGGVKQGSIPAPTLFALYFTVVFLVSLQNNKNGTYINFKTSRKLFNIRTFTARTNVLQDIIRDFFFSNSCDLKTHNDKEMQELVTCFKSTY